MTWEVVALVLGLATLLDALLIALAFSESVKLRSEARLEAARRRNIFDRPVE